MYVVCGCVCLRPLHARVCEHARARECGYGGLEWGAVISQHLQGLRLKTMNKGSPQGKLHLKLLPEEIFWFKNACLVVTSFLYVFSIGVRWLVMLP